MRSDRVSEEYDQIKSLNHSNVISAYRVAEFATLARDGSPVCWPLAPDFERGHLLFSTGYMYPTKARNAQRNPHVAVLFSDPTASGRTDNDPLVLVQGLAEVSDQDLQRNTERYVDQLLRKGPLPFRVLVRTPGLRQIMVGYLARIWIEVTPHKEYIWMRQQPPAEQLRISIRPATFTPGPGIHLPQEIFEWLSRYPRPPVLAYVDQAGWPVMTRVQATVKSSHIMFANEVDTREGAPACLTYHRLRGNYLSNDAFLIRGHFDAVGNLIPEKFVGYGGTHDDRGLGSLKLMRILLDYRKQLSLQMEKESRPLPIVRPTPKL
jgi:hypothetical protein